MNTTSNYSSLGFLFWHNFWENFYNLLQHKTIIEIQVCAKCVCVFVSLWGESIRKDARKLLLQDYTLLEANLAMICVINSTVQYLNGGVPQNNPSIALYKSIILIFFSCSSIVLLVLSCYHSYDNPLLHSRGVAASTLLPTIIIIIIMIVLLLLKIFSPSSSFSGEVSDIQATGT